ncbi:MAG: deoxyribose-phosphate aldolase [Armatimonadetes bacterium]|nr:deoxyribose-phosphate aldolase [Armatimonadota bacterium]
MTQSQLSQLIDHTALKPETTAAQIVQLCTQAATYRFASVCVMPFWVRLAATTLKELGASVPVCTVIGFPNGAHATTVKVAEAIAAVNDGATELDMVMNAGALKSGQHDVVRADIAQVAAVAHQHGAILKVILETSLLTDAEKRHACQICVAANADFVKTSTGFSSGGATVEDVRLMRESVPETMGVKASGGIRDYATAMAMIEAGATRIGASASVAIVHAAVYAPQGDQSNQLIDY